MSAKRTVRLSKACPLGPKYVWSAARAYCRVRASIFSQRLTHTHNVTLLSPFDVRPLHLHNLPLSIKSSNSARSFKISASNNICAMLFSSAPRIAFPSAGILALQFLPCYLQGSPQGRQIFDQPIRARETGTYLSV
jgi:hypothetical protein